MERKATSNDVAAMSTIPEVDIVLAAYRIKCLSFDERHLADIIGCVMAFAAEIPVTDDAALDDVDCFVGFHRFATRRGRVQLGNFSHHRNDIL